MSKDARPVAAELLLFASDDVAVIVRHVTAHVDGLTWDLVIRLREPQARPIDHRELRHRVESADGSTPAESRGAGSMTECYVGEFTAAVSGDVTFVFDWPARGISDARASLARRARP